MLFFRLVLFPLIYIFLKDYMTKYCGSEIDMIMEGINAGRLVLDDNYVGDCNVTIEAWLTATNRLMFYFEDLDIPKTDTFYCDDAYLEVYNGMPPDVEPFYGKFKPISC